MDKPFIIASGVTEALIRIGLATLSVVVVLVVARVIEKSLRAQAWWVARYVAPAWRVARYVLAVALWTAAAFEFVSAFMNPNFTGDWLFITMWLLFAAALVGAGWMAWPIQHSRAAITFWWIVFAVGIGCWLSVVAIMFAL